MSEKQRLWDSNIEEVRYETIHYSRGLDELIDSLIELGEKPLYQRDSRVYTTRDMLETLREINNRMNKDAIREGVQLKETEIWREYSSYFTREQNIRRAIGETNVHTNEDAVVTSHPRR